MKYLVLFLLALVIPVSAAHAVKSPYVSNNIDNVERALNQKNPFSSNQARKYKKMLTPNKLKHNSGRYNGDESKGAKISKKKEKQDRRGHKGRKRAPAATVNE